MFRTYSPLTPQALAAFIDRHEWTRAEAARELGIGSSTLYAILKGERPISRTIERLVIALDKVAA